jgi:hypothetical protein
VSNIEDALAAKKGSDITIAAQKAKIAKLRGEKAVLTDKNTALEEVFNTTDSLFIDYEQAYSFYDVYGINNQITSLTRDNAPKKAFEVYDCETGPSCVVLPDCQMLAEPTGEDLFLYHNERHSLYECVTMGECTALGLMATDGDGYQCA